MVMFLRLMLIVVVVVYPNLAGAGCNSPSHMTYYMTFSESASEDSSHVTKYGLEDINDEIHISTEVGDNDDNYTYVQLYVRNSRGDVTVFSYPDKLQFSVGDSSLISGKKDNWKNPIPITGATIALWGLKQATKVADSKTTISINYAGGTGTCGSFVAHSYNKKTISNWHVYLEDGVNINQYSTLLSEINRIVKPAVMEFSAPTMHENYDMDEDDNGIKDYDDNGNGTFDLYRDTLRDLPGKEYQPERDKMIKYLKETELDGNPITLVLNGAYHAFHIISISTDRHTVYVKDPYEMLSVGRNDLLIADYSDNQIDSISSSGLTTALHMRYQIASDVSTDDIIRIPGEVNIKQVTSENELIVEAAICSATDSIYMAIHETLHCRICGELSDLDPAGADVDNNVMRAENMGDGVLRCKSLPLVSGGDEIQWDSVH